jgi:hypothetical protein
MISRSKIFGEIEKKTSHKIGEREQEKFYKYYLFSPYRKNHQPFGLKFSAIRLMTFRETV